MDDSPSSLPTAEFAALARRLESFHELFRALWELGMPEFSDRVRTAAVVFSAAGAPLRFLVNREFWEELPTYDRDFVVCHEMLHAILNHGYRGLGLEHRQIANVAADIAVNHLLVHQFGFQRELLQDWKSICWVDTVFNKSPKKIPPTDLTLEQYYEMILDRCDVIEVNLVDEHYFEPEAGGSLIHGRAASELQVQITNLEPELIKEIKQKLGREATVEVTRGNLALGLWSSVEPSRRMRVKWEDFIRRRIGKSAPLREVEGWVNEPRRFMSAKGLMIPGIMEERRHSKDHRQHCVFYIDTSGSAWEYRDRFFALAQSLPEERFAVELCSFDTKVYSLDIRKPEVLGGGGTDFAILEQYLHSREARGSSKSVPGSRLPYPDVVIVLTDGYGTQVRPKHPDRWHWLLTTTYANLVPAGGKTLLLRDFL